MFVTAALHETKIASELEVQCVCRIPNDVEPAAALPTVLGKRGNEYECSPTDRATHLCDILCAIGSVGEKMKDRAIKSGDTIVARPVSCGRGDTSPKNTSSCLTNSSTPNTPRPPSASVTHRAPSE